MLLTLTTTNPTLVLNANPRRKKVAIQMESTSIKTSNTGRIHIGTDFQPVATVGHSLQGDVLLQAAGIEEPQGDAIISERWKKQIWATASATSQTLTVDEEIEP